MQITVVEHPLIKHKLSKMRDINSTSRDFREWLDEIAMLMTYEVHFVCKKCRAVSDLHMSPLEHIDVLAKDGFDGEIDGHFVPRAIRRRPAIPPSRRAGSPKMPRAATGACRP